jgi:hypothetical protein
LEDRTVPSFLPAVNYSVDPGPNTVAVGDFNGDHKLDIVTANSGSNTVSVLLGNGDGTFKPASNYLADTGTNYVAVGDFNGDGKLDIVTLNLTAGDLSVLLGNGDGTFQAPKNFSLPPAPSGASQLPWAVAVGDVNRDGKLDLVVTAQTVTYPQLGYVDVLLGNGDGTFTAGNIYQLRDPPPQYSVALADVMGGGKLDIVVPNYTGKSISLFAGKGDGTFQTPVFIATGANPVGVAVGDLNGDGKPDLAVANNGDNSVTVLLNKGHGKFHSQNYTVGHVPNGLVLADFDRDGNLDIATDNESGQDVSVLLGKGNGTFQSAQSYGTDLAPWWIASGDFNGDGYPDLVTVNKAAADISVLLNNATWTAPIVLVSALALPNTANPTALPSTVPAPASTDAPALSAAILTSRDLATPKAETVQEPTSARGRFAALDRFFVWDRGWDPLEEALSA